MAKRKPANTPERLAAIAAGEKTFLSPKPCKNGHESPRRYASTGTCVECAIASVRRYQERHPDRIAAYHQTDAHKESQMRARKSYYARYPERRIASVRRWQAANPEKVKQYARRSALNDTEAVKARRVRYLLADPERARNIAASRFARYRAKKRQNGGSATTVEIAALRKRQRGKCAGCDQRHKRLELDHIMPIAKGGRHDIDNLQFLCRQCNSTKNARDAIDWAQSQGRLL